MRDDWRNQARLPSIDPELLLRILLVGYLYGITSERKLVEELRTHLAWRWFTGLGFDQEIPHHLHIFQEPAWAVSGVEAVRAALRTDRAASVWKWDWLQGKHLSVDGSFVEANAAKESRIPRRAARGSSASVYHTVRQYLEEVEQRTPVEANRCTSRIRLSTTDPDSTYATKGGTPAGWATTTTIWWTITAA